MPSGTIKKTVRYDAADVRDAERLFGSRRFSRVASYALKKLLRKHRRRAQDEALRAWLSGRTAEQQAEDRDIVQAASRGSLRVLEGETP